MHTCMLGLCRSCATSVQVGFLVVKFGRARQPCNALSRPCLLCSNVAVHAGHINHDIFWTNLAPEKVTPGGDRPAVQCAMLPTCQLPQSITQQLVACQLSCFHSSVCPLPEHSAQLTTHAATSVAGAFVDGASATCRDVMHAWLLNPGFVLSLTLLLALCLRKTTRREPQLPELCVFCFKRGYPVLSS